MRNALSGLEEHEALGGIGPVEAPAGEVIHQRRVIKLRVVAAERQAKAVFPLGGAMTGAARAADLVDDGLHVPDEAHGEDFFEVLDRNRDLRFEPFCLDGDGSLTVLDGGEIAVGIEAQEARGGLEPGLGGEVDSSSRLRPPGDEKTAGILRAREGEGGRIRLEALNGCGIRAGLEGWKEEQGCERC